MHRYSARGHGSMVDDDVRVDAYARAIRGAVRPGDVVVEIGAGTGLFSILALRCGARRVYAIECDDIIEVARENAARNGADGIEFIHALSTDVELPERADVVISDMRGVLPLYERHLHAIVDARRRFLAPGGTLVPRADSVKIACVDAGALYAEMVRPWSTAPLGIDMGAGRRLVVDNWQRVQFEAGDLLTGPADCGTIDYRTVERPRFEARVSMDALRAGVAHGFCAWFEGDLADGVAMSNAPTARPLVYGQAYFPWPEPVPLAPGDEVEVSLQSAFVADDYVWTWETRCRGDSGPRFRQSSFAGTPLSAERLRRISASHVAKVGDDAGIDRAILAGMEEGRELGAIARDLAARFPVRFPRWEDALARVGELSLRYGR